MKYFREYTDARKTESWGDRVVCAVSDVGPFYAALGIEEDVNFIGETTCFNEYYRDTFCEEVSEEKARELHPELFMYLKRNGLLTE